MVPDVLQALRIWLSSEASIRALVDDRVYGQELDSATANLMPVKAIVLTDAGGRANGPSSHSWMREGASRVDCRSYGETPWEAKSVDLAVFELMRNLVQKGVHGQAILRSATVEGGPVPLRDPDTSWPFVFSSYRIMASEVPV